MKQFSSIQKLDTAILYCLELASSTSVLLLAFGLIASMANVLTKGSVLTDHVWMQQVWAWTQCIAIDASVAGTIIRTYRYHQEGEQVKTWLYGILSLLLLFTAAIVSNIEAVQQTLNLTLDAAYTHVFIPVETLIWVRSIVIVLLIVAHALRHVGTQGKQAENRLDQQPVMTITPELVALLQGLVQNMLTQAYTSIREDRADSIEQQRDTSLTLVLGEPRQIAAPEDEELPQVQQSDQPEAEPGEEPVNNFERVRAYLAQHPQAKVTEVAEALSIAMSTASKHVSKVRGGK